MELFQNVKVLSLEQATVVPYLTYRLAQDGMEVIRLEHRGSSQVVTVLVPLAEMFGYATQLRSMTQGRATYTMQFQRYSEVPKNIANEVVSRVRGFF